MSSSYEKVPMLDAESDGEREHFTDNSKSRSPARRYLPHILCHTALFCLYTSILLYIFKGSRIVDSTSRLTENEQYSHSPGHAAVRYRPFTFNAAPNLTSPYVGENRPSLDQAWHDLLKYTNMRVSKEDLDKNNRESIALGKGGGYYGEMAVFHELHCLKFIRQAFHMDHYGKYFGEEERRNMGEHTEHCIELLRQGVMCRGDTTLITFKWGHRVKLPQPDFTLEHRCVDWDHLMDWSSQHAIDVFEEGMLVHPTLGPSYPGGHREDRPVVQDATT